MKILLIALTALIAVAPTANAAVTSVPRNGMQVCHVYGNYTNATKSRSDISGYKECGNSAQMEQFVGFRIEPMVGVSLTPIMKGNLCFFLTNASANSYFVPAATDKELLQFLAHKPNGVSVVPCTAPGGQEVSLQDRCGGKLTTDGIYANGFEALSIGRAGMDRRNYSIVSADGKLLRTMTAVATQTGWALSYDRACPAANGSTTANATAAAFNRLEPAAGQRIFINDGALQRNIRG